MNRTRLLIPILVTWTMNAHGVPIIVEYSSQLDKPNGNVTFSVLFDGPPQISTILDDSQPDSLAYVQSLQFNIDPTSILRGSGRTQDGHRVTPNMRTLSCNAQGDMGGQTCQNFTYSIYTGDNEVVGGFGSLPYLIHGNTFSLTVSLEQLNDTDDEFTYSIEDGAPDSEVRNVFYGTSGVSHRVSVTEPSTFSLLSIAIGCIFVFCVMRRQAEMGGYPQKVGAR